MVVFGTIAILNINRHCAARSSRFMAFKATAGGMIRAANGWHNKAGAYRFWIAAGAV